VCVYKTQGKSLASAGTSFEARESALAEECDAICRLHGVPAGAALPAQLKALDAEYHQLLDRGQSAKADHIQALFAWKSKTATQVSLPYLTLPYLRGGCLLVLGRHPALRPQHRPSAHPRQTSRLIEPL